jgi:hypothetical protein
MSLLFRAQKLIDLACSTTHEEEARTAALTACRLIRKHGMQLSVGHVRDSEVGRRARDSDPYRPRTAAEPVRQKPPNGGSFSRATRSRRCESCGDSIALGDEIYVVAGVTWCGRH